jgi:hypothetical protein
LRQANACLLVQEGFDPTPGVIHEQKLARTRSHSTSTRLDD